MPRGQGRRCSGYLSSDERFAYCTREEHAGQAPLEPTDPPSWRHFLEGECRCGATHGFAPNGAVATYDYVDENRQLLYQVVRLTGKQFRQRRPDGNGGWIWNLNATRRVLYHLPSVLEAAQAGETVYVVEGEKDVHAIEHAGGTATCNPGGAGKWKPEYAAALKGARVVIVADRDKPGLDHALAVAATLPTAPIVQACEGKDVYDHLAAGHTLDELQPLPPDDQPKLTEIIFETLRDFLRRPLPKSESLVGVTRNGTNLLPRYGWVMPWGREGSGKTSVLVDLIFHACTGRAWLNYPVARPLRIVAVVNEGVPGGLQDKLQQKTECWDGDVDMVLDNLAVYVSPWGEFTFKNTTIADHARAFAVDFGADYVALDPLHTLGTTGSGTPEETEQFKHTLREFGLWNDLGIITAHHSNKNGMVSGDWARHPDTVIRLEKDGKRPATKLTLEKARPADPAELGVPIVLEWEPETMGYRRVELDASHVTDDDLRERIYTVLRNADQALTKTDLKKAVTGNKNRIGDLIDDEIKAGRIIDETPEKRSTRLRITTPEIRRYEQAENTAQTRMNTESSSYLTAGYEPESSPEGSSFVPPSSSRREERRDDTNYGPNEAEAEDAWAARIADEPDLTETEWDNR